MKLNKLTKKLLCILLSGTLLSSLAMSMRFVSAEENGDGTAWQYRDALVQSLGISSDVTFKAYDELYSHCDYYGNVDWALIYCVLNDDVGDVFFSYTFDDIQITRSEEWFPFSSGYGVYDPAENRFFELSNVWESGKYEGLHEIFASEYHRQHGEETEPGTVYNAAMAAYCPSGSYVAYRELYDHYGSNGKSDWTLLYFVQDDSKNSFHELRYGDIAVITNKLYRPFDGGYAIYDFSQKRFYGYYDIYGRHSYEGLDEIFKSEFGRDNIGKEKQLPPIEEVRRTFKYWYPQKYEQLTCEDKKDCPGYGAYSEFYLIHFRTSNCQDTAYFSRIGKNNEYYERSETTDANFPSGIAVFCGDPYLASYYYSMSELVRSRLVQVKPAVLDYFFEQIGWETFGRYCDVTADCKVNVNDVTAMQRHLASVEPFEQLQLQISDANGDNTMDIQDVTYLQRYLAEFETTFG